MNGMVRLAGAALMVTSVLSGCSPSQTTFEPCPMEVTEVVIYTAYANHPRADRQELTGAYASTFCFDAFPYDTLEPRSFEESELGQRQAAVIQLVGEDEAVRTIWIYRLAGVDAGTAIILDTGQSFYLPNTGPQLYLLAAAEDVQRSEMPSRT